MSPGMSQRDLPGWTVTFTALQLSADAEREGLIVRTPGPQRGGASQGHARDADVESEAGRFLAHVADERLFAMWRLFLTTGMRRGEIAALRWSDVDLRHSRLSVRDLALLAGIHPNVVSERLGHANISIAPNLHTHVTEGMDRDAADLVAQLLDG